MDMAISQCPRSYVTDDSIFWVEEYFRIRQASDGAKSSYTSSLVDADARFVEAMTIIEQESISLENQLHKAAAR